MIDGFQESALRGLAKSHTDYRKEMKSIGCLKLALLSNGTDGSIVEQIIGPLRDLQEKRSKFGGHGGAKPDFDMTKDCRQILERVEKSLGLLQSTIESVGSEK